MIIAPLVFTTLVVGIAKMGDTTMIGRVGGKAMLWFISASLISLLLGLVLVNCLEHGHVTKFTIQDANSVLGINNIVKGFSLEDFVKHIVLKKVFLKLLPPMKFANSTIFHYVWDSTFSV